MIVTCEVSFINTKKVLWKYCTRYFIGGLSHLGLIMSFGLWKNTARKGCLLM